MERNSVEEILIDDQEKKIVLETTHTIKIQARKKAK